MKEQNPKTYGIISIVFAGISFFIFGFLSFGGLFLGISGLVISLKEKKSIYYDGSNSAVVLNIIGIVLSAIMAVLYIMALQTINAA